MPKKILSLDGGGSWAILQAMALKHTYSNTDIGTNCRMILNQFDLVVANSGGSLMLAAMIEHADEDIDVVIEMFKNPDIRSNVFSKLRIGERAPVEFLARRLGFGPKYKASRKDEGFRKALPTRGNIELQKINLQVNIKPNILICGFDYDRNRATFFRSHDDPSSTEPGKIYECTLINAINASSNAPVNYFNEPVKFKYDGTQHRYWDGAVGGNNNPVLIGITEALALWGLNEFQVLSIGTGCSVLPVKGFTVTDNSERAGLVKELEVPKFTKDILKMSTSIISEPPDAANFMAHMILGGKAQPTSDSKLVRMNVQLQPIFDKQKNKWSLPAKMSEEEKNTFMYLINLDMDAVGQTDVLKIEQLGNWWIKDVVRNQPIRVVGKELGCSIGFSEFSEAKRTWLKWNGLVPKEEGVFHSQVT
ncbi:MAG TPA: patatin-like phospholipase family protein [Bacteroidia bacterium]|nr:patatin-like phospholipase family protein [Bacteroidia bacterium]HRH09636.1 patatin-like phospholipase family protein [Bacteroidia bacterium]